jgi:hypothetical protein
MIEEVEEVGREPSLHPLGEVEVFEEREVDIPAAWTEVERSRIWVHGVGDWSLPNHAVCQSLRQPVVESRSQRVKNSFGTVYRHQSLQGFLRDIRGLTGIEISSEP